MPTPSSGAISMNDMRSEITRATTSALGMDEIRTRYGGSGAISFNDLRNCEGFTVTCSSYADKYVGFDGWSAPGTVVGSVVGSVSPDEASGYIQFAANSFLGVMVAGYGIDTSAIIGIYANTGLSTSGVTAGFRGDSVTRIVTANTSRTLGTGTETARDFTYDMPSTGTIHCLIKF